MISKQARDFIDSINISGRVLGINLDSIPYSFKTPFSCKKCGSHDYRLSNFLVKCNNCGNVEEKLLMKIDK